MSEENENRSKWIKIRLRPAEQLLLERKYKRTTSRTLSEYARALLLGKPVTVLLRDKSMDEILEELLLLRRELNAAGNNLNQAVRNINSAHGAVNERLLENLRLVIADKLEPSISEINDKMTQYAMLWSQKLKAGKA